MNPKNKAIELLDRFAPLAKYWDCYNDEPLEENNAKICALIVVNELIKLYEYENPHRGFKISYWDEVKTEIKKL